MIYYFMLLFTSLLWAGNFVVSKSIVGHASAMVLADLRWGLAVIMLLPYVWLKERKLLPPRKALLPLIYMGLTGVSLFNVFMFHSLEFTTADNDGLISALNPITIAIAAYFILREHLNARQIIAMIISFIGVLIVISHGRMDHVLHLEFNRGDLLMLLGVIMWGLYSVSGKIAMKYVSPLMSTFWGGAFGVLMLIPFSISHFSIQQPNVTFVMEILYISFGGTVLAMFFWNIAVNKIGGTRAGIFLNFNPIFTAIISFFYLGETMDTLQWLGTAVVISGVLLFNLSKAKKMLGTVTSK
ncbi:MAG: protein of unknown function transrane [Bacilli bacterium]|nr:protein of unknown function transrane [Bacilli bacterium]